MNTFLNSLHQIPIASFLRAILLLIFGFMIAKGISKALGRILTNHVSAHLTMILKGFVFYLIFLLFIASAIQALGFQISALLGATGILTIAIGIASQSSMSNLVSGIFIIGEKPFALGDTIRINDMEGEVSSIDFFSVKIKTADNTMIRIPNESLIKHSIVNLSYFSTRRVDITIRIAYKESISTVRKVFFKTVEDNPLCLREPKPVITILNFGESAMNVQFSAWTQKENYATFKTNLFESLKMAFEKNHIEIPFPSLSFYTGSTSTSLPVQLVDSTKNE